MKKFFVFFVLVISFASISFGAVRIEPDYVPDTLSSRETKIANTIQNSEWINYIDFGVDNPDLIYPGGQLYYHLPNGRDTFYVIKEGDSQTTIIGNILDGNHNDSIDFDDHNAVVSDCDSSKNFFSFLWNRKLWHWILVVFVSLMIFYFIYENDKNRKKKIEWNQDPIKSGEPQVPGGVSDEDAHSRTVEIFEQHFPRETFVITSITRGRLSGPANVHYNGELLPKQRILENIAAYRGVALIDGDEEVVYFLQPCGNDASAGNFMGGEDLIFIPDVLNSEIIIPEDKSEITTDDNKEVSSLKKEEIPVIEKVETEKPVAKKEVISEEQAFSDLVTGAYDSMSKFTEMQNLHKGRIEITSPKGFIFKMEVDTKNEAKNKIN